MYRAYRCLRALYERASKRERSHYSIVLDPSQLLDVSPSVSYRACLRGTKNCTRANGVLDDKFHPRKASRCAHHMFRIARINLGSMGSQYVSVDIVLVGPSRGLLRTDNAHVVGERHVQGEFVGFVVWVTRVNTFSPTDQSSL